MDKDTRKVSLVGMAWVHSTMLNKVAKRMQYCCSYLKTKDMLDDV